MSAQDAATDSSTPTVRLAGFAALLREHGLTVGVAEQQAMLQAMLRDEEPPLSPAVARRLLAHFQPPPVSTPAADGLTDREREVLQLVSKGYSVPQAAKALEISPNTAHTHIKSVYRKLKVASRAEAVLAARALGLA